MNVEKSKNEKNKKLENEEGLKNKKKKSWKGDAVDALLGDTDGVFVGGQRTVFCEQKKRKEKKKKKTLFSCFGSH